MGKSRRALYSTCKVGSAEPDGLAAEGEGGGNSWKPGVSENFLRAALLQTMESGISGEHCFELWFSCPIS